MRLLGVESARQLAEIMAAVGLAQNFAALRALATEGIQKGHMTLHARSVVTAAGVPEALFDDVLDRLVLSNEIKVWKAREIAAELKRDSGPQHLHTARTVAEADAMGVGYAKVVLLGEHAVVYGRHAIGAPVPMTVTAVVEDCDEGIHLMIPRWGVEYQLARNPKDRRSFERTAGRGTRQTGLERAGDADRGILGGAPQHGIGGLGSHGRGDRAFAGQALWAWPVG